MDGELLQLLPHIMWVVLGGAVFVSWWNLQFRQPYSVPRLRNAHRLRLRSYRVQADAEQRAEEMLRAVLGEAQFTQFVRRGYLEVRSPTFPGRVYFIPERQGPVTVCEQGRPMMRLCVQCVERVPDYDTVAMHKLMIEAHEREYLRVANRV
jgi:hypothetical protein